MEEEIGTENGGMIKDEGNDENEEGEDGLTPGDLLAFAWQICQGMVRTLRSLCFFLPHRHVSSLVKPLIRNSLIYLI